MSPENKPIKVVIAKPGLDGHDVGAKVLCRTLMEAGMEVTYTGLRRSPAEIARAVVDEEAEVLGLSILSGAHLQLTRAITEELERVGAGEVVLIAGGNIPAGDHAALGELGVAAVFNTGSAPEDVVRFLVERVGR